MKYTLTILFMLFPLLDSSVLSQEIISRYTIGGGAVINAGSGGTYRISATAGQIVAESSREGSFWLFSGFWVPADTSRPLGKITLLEPTGGESWRVKDIRAIQWQANEFVSSVHIELSRNDKNWETLFSNIPGSAGSQSWTVGMPRSDNCRLRIRSARDSRVFDTSSLFSIIPAPTTGLTKEDKQPSGSSRQAYRLISVPIDLENPSPANVLVDDLGGYDSTKWRFFDYQKGSYREFGSARDFTPGRSFFLIVKDGATIDAGIGELVADSLVSVPLDSGWNYIANPYNDIDLPFSSLSHREGLHSYNGSWVPVETFNTLKPWEGYSVWVDSAVVLKIRLPQSGAAFLPKKNSSPENGWALHLTSQCQDANDRYNYAGVRTGASETWDSYDRLKPPPIGDYVRVYFPHRDWPRKANIYRADFRPEGGSAYAWDFEVKSTIEDLVTLTFERLEDLPLDFEVWVLDRVHNRSQNLRENNQYRFVNLKKEQLHQMTLLAGDKNYVQRQLYEANAVPAHYALFNNFPNPFNNTTAIRYALPGREKVTLKIYNILGQEVAVLLDGEFRDNGYHIEYWNGRNQFGEAVASGIYIYRLRAGNFTGSEKMILIK